MMTSWVKGLRKGTQEYKEVEEAYRASTRIRDRMRKVLGGMLEESHKQRITSTEYDNPNWAYKQADAVGYARAIHQIIKLLEDNKEKD